MLASCAAMLHDSRCFEAKKHSQQEMFTSELHMAFFTFKHQNVQLFCVPSRRVWLDELPYAYKERTKRNVEDELAPTKVRTRGSCVLMYPCVYLLPDCRLPVSVHARF